MKKTIVYFTILFYSVISVPASGYLVGGKIVDEHREPIPAAHIYIPDRNIGASADLDGKYLLSIPDGKQNSSIKDVHFQITAVGYSQKDTFLTLVSDTTIDVVLKSQALVADPVVVSASRMEQRLLDTPITTSVASGDAIETRATNGIDDAIRYLPGITMNKYQISIRNSSGFSQGAGSRVAMMIDGVPVLAGDTGEIKWDALPSSAINQVEVVKGAGSSMYGSGALGGAINIITKIPKSRMLKLWTKVGAYDEPHWEQWRWSDKIRTLKSAGFQWGDKLSSLAYIITGDFAQNDGYRENDDYIRAKSFSKLHWDISPNRAISAFIDAAYEDRGSYFKWKSQTYALEAQDSTENDRVWSSKLFSAITYRGDSPKRHFFFNTKLYNSFNNWESKIYNTDADSFEQESSISDKIGLDAQTMFTWKKQLLTIGAELSLAANKSVTFGNHIGAGGAIFSQDEISILHPLVINTGLRFDIFWVDSASLDYFLGASPKLSAIYHINEHSAARIGVSSGFRIPTMAELFTRTNAGGILRVEPNPDLKPEQGYTAEFGANYIRDGLLIDGAVFYNFYSDMIEPVQQIDVGSVDLVKFENLRQVQIYGTELTAKWSWKRLKLSGNYLYTDSRDLDTDEKLPYRPDHSITLSGTYNLLDNLSFTADWRYKSEYEYVINTADVKVPQKVLDLQTRYKFHHFTFTFRVNNVMNYNYVEVEENLAPIRHYVLKIEADIL
ncbi:TonB-dependent receptor [bacterium]|nr:TonB-dependent receptor [bacterium]